MPPLYFYHYMAFVESVHILLGDSISIAKIEHCQVLLNYFVFMFGTLYGERYQTLNLHLLVHLPTTVRDIGPLWAHSCFAFENANGDLLKMFHVTKYIDIQIVSAVHAMKAIPLMVGSLEDNSNGAKRLLSKLMKRELLPHGNDRMRTMMGAGFILNVDKNTTARICQFLGTCLQKFVFYKRAMSFGQVYHSMQYTRIKTKNYCTVKYNTCDNILRYGVIKWFAEHTTGDTCRSDYSMKFVCISVLEHAPLTLCDISPSTNFLGLNMAFITPMQTPKNEMCDFIPLDNIMSPCLCIEMGHIMFLCESPNVHEVNL